MQCERLIKMIKSWYIHVREETMAPARMITFIEEHAESCDVCRQDPDLKEEIAKITELVLPESKIPKAVRQRSSVDDESESDDEMDIDENDDDEETDDSLDEEGEDEEDLDLDDDDDLSSDLEDEI
jgi:ABC-type nitrate/sulfonate/bicarbonate transport system substrate-binding protein